MHALGDEERAILDDVEDHHRISNCQYRALLGVSIHRASYLLNKLTKNSESIVEHALKELTDWEHLHGIQQARIPSRH